MNLCTFIIALQLHFALGKVEISSYLSEHITNIEQTRVTK